MTHEADIRDHFLQQADACEKMGSPLTARVLRLALRVLGSGTALDAPVLNWSGNPKSDALALRVAGGLHALVRQGSDARLAEFYRAPRQVADGDAEAILADAFDQHRDALLRALASAPQTNEIGRSAVLIAAGHWLTARFGLPIVLSELGASAGLNMLWDHYALQAGGRLFGPADATLTLTPEWRGGLPPHASPTIRERAGVDLNPIDPGVDGARLLAYIWADQTDRLDRTSKALALAAQMQPRIDQADAIDWLSQRLEHGFPGAVHLIYHTIAWQYFPQASQARGAALFAEAGQRATETTPVAHLSMEADEQPGSAALWLTIWPKGELLFLGRADFHGRWVDWQAAAP